LIAAVFLIPSAIAVSDCDGVYSANGDVGVAYQGQAVPILVAQTQSYICAGWQGDMNDFCIGAYKEDGWVFGIKCIGAST